jgi:hypothetical protein
MFVTNDIINNFIRTWISYLVCYRTYKYVITRLLIQLIRCYVSYLVSEFVKHRFRSLLISSRLVI